MAAHERSLLEIFGARTKMPDDELAELSKFVSLCKKEEIMTAYNRLRAQRSKIAQEYSVAFKFIEKEFKTPELWALYKEYINLQTVCINLQTVYSIIDENHSTYIRFKELGGIISQRAKENKIALEVVLVAANDKLSESESINSCGYMFSRESPINWTQNKCRSRPGLRPGPM